MPNNTTWNGYISIILFLCIPIKYKTDVSIPFQVIEHYKLKWTEKEVKYFYTFTFTQDQNQQ